MAVELEKQRGRVESALASPCKVLELRGTGALQLRITEQLCVCVCLGLQEKMRPAFLRN